MLVANIHENRIRNTLSLLLTLETTSTFYPVRDQDLEQTKISQRKYIITLLPYFCRRR